MADDGMADDGTTDDDITIEDNPAEHRFEIAIAGERVGLAEYQRTSTTMIFTHTEIKPDVARRGLGGKLVGFALDAARDEGLMVVPRCEFVVACIGKHPEYLDLVDEEHRAELIAWSTG